MSGFGEYPRGTGDPALGHELTGFEIAKVNRTQRTTQAGGNGYQGNGSPAGQSVPQDDPWATPQTAGTTGGGWGSGPDSEPPF
jgi:hypothetical protein